MNSAIGTILCSLWLPALVLVISFVRFGIDGPWAAPGAAGVLWLFGLAWPVGISLTLAVRLMHRRPQVLSRVLAYGCAVVLGLVSAWGVIIGGLFGPIGAVAYPLSASLPAWIILGVLTRVQGGAGGRLPRRNPGWLPRNPVGDGFCCAESTNLGSRCSPGPGL